MTKVRMSKEGEFLLPKELMEAHGFVDGAEVEVSGGAKQIVLRLVEEAVAEKAMTVKEFLARRPVYTGPPITQEMIDHAILEEAKRRWDEKNSR